MPVCKQRRLTGPIYFDSIYVGFLLNNGDRQEKSRNKAKTRGSFNVRSATVVWAAVMMAARRIGLLAAAGILRWR